MIVTNKLLKGIGASLWDFVESSCLRCKRGGATPSSSLYTVNDLPWSKDQFHDRRKDSSPNWRSSFLSNHFFNQKNYNSSLTFRWVQPAWQVSNFTVKACDTFWSHDSSDTRSAVTTSLELRHIFSHVSAHWWDNGARTSAVRSWGTSLLTGWSNSSRNSQIASCSGALFWRAMNV